MRRERLTLLALGAVAAVLLLGGFTFPGTVQRLWRKADRAVARKDYPTAVQLYEQAQQLRPQEWALRYNAAVAAGMGDQHDKAVTGLQAVAKDGPEELKEPAEYNIGNCFLAQGKSKEAVEHYKRALYLKPDDANAKWNLELAKRQQQKQKQEQQKQNQQQQRRPSPKPQPKPPQQQQQQPQPQPQKQMSQEEARRLLQSLSQQDRDLQKQLRQVRKQPFRETRPEKDW